MQIVKYQSFCEVNYSQVVAIYQLLKNTTQLERYFTKKYRHVFTFFSQKSYRYSEFVSFYFKQPEFINLEVNCLQRFELLLCHDVKLVEVLKINHMKIKHFATHDKQIVAELLTNALKYSLGYLNKIKERI